MFVRLARVLPFLALDIPEGESPGALLTRALRAAEAGDPAAWGLCERLAQGEGAGMCKVAASAAMPDRGAACDRIQRAYWRGECWFEVSEDHTDAGRWEAAIDACRRAEDFDADCARHVWWASVSATGTRDEAFLARLAETFEMEPAQLDKGAAASKRAEKEADAREAARLQAEAAADTMQGVLRWRSHFREQLRVDTAACPADEREVCVAAATDELRARWERALEHNAAAKVYLCDGTGSVAERLKPGDEPALIALLDTLRQGSCGAE